MTFEVPEFKYESMLSASDTAGVEAHAPMPGVIEKILVEPGQTVKQGDALVVMIAMKMEVKKFLRCYFAVSFSFC